MYLGHASPFLCFADDNASRRPGFRAIAAPIARTPIACVERISGLQNACAQAGPKQIRATYSGNSRTNLIVRNLVRIAC